MLRISFRNGFYAGVIVSIALGIYLFFLWQPRRQVQLHSEHLLHAVEKKKWSATEKFMSENYHDQWMQDRGAALSRLREVVRYMPNLRLQRQELLVHAADGRGEWRGRITVEADANEVSAFVKERVNALRTPFELQWQQQSGKPWDWKLVRARNADLKISAEAF